MAEMSMAVISLLMYIFKMPNRAWRIVFRSSMLKSDWSSF